MRGLDTGAGGRPNEGDRDDRGPQPQTRPRLDPQRNLQRAGVIGERRQGKRVVMGRYLVVANQTLGGEQLTAALDELALAEPCVLLLAVPVTDTEGSQQWDYPPIDRFIPDAHRIAASLAAGRLEHELVRLRRAGVEASGEVMDAMPIGRIRELLDTERFDGVIVSTLPRRLSRWLVMDLPHRVARGIQVPVTHVEGNAGPSL